MKKLINPLAILFILTMAGCVNEPDTYYQNKDVLYDVPAGTLLTDAQKELADQMTTASVNLSAWRFFTQYWTETQYTTESRYRIKTRKIGDNLWNNLFRDVLGNLNSAKDAVNKEVKPSATAQADWNSQQQNKIAIIDIQMVYAYQVLVDTFGDIPYTESLTPSNVLPHYDDDATIYPKLISRLNDDIAMLNTTGSSFETGDYINNGDVPSWMLFANSLKVKLGINIADVNSALAQTTIESAVAGGVITSNSDNTTFMYTASAPNYNPIYADLVVSGRNDFVPAAPFVNALNALNDPRRPAYFTPLSSGNYVGGVYAATNAYANFSHVATALKAANAPGILFDAAEVNFYLAEAAARGYNVGGSAETFYNTAIQASFDFYGVGSAAAYLLDPAVAYTSPGSGATWQQKIGQQEWIALYNRPFEAWNAWRRLDYPVLVAPANAYSEAEGEIPKRYTYPIIEQTVNGENYQAASAAIGGDKLKTHVFWDIN